LKTRRLVIAFVSLLLTVCGAIATVSPASAASSRHTIGAHTDDLGSFGGQLIDENSGQCLGISGASKTEGAAAIQWNCDNFPDQTWIVEPAYDTADGSYNIINQNSAMCLGISGASETEGATAIQWPCDGFTDQDWFETNNGQFIDENSGQCLGILNASTKEGVNALQWNCDNFPDQSWSN
jgi:hypothetical protein